VVEKRVIVLRSRKSGAYVLNPMGTFKGYGGYVGIAPYRELDADCSTRALGEVTISLLQVSAPTGYHIRDVVRYQHEQFDEESLRIANAHLPPQKADDAFIDRNFHEIEVFLRNRQKSWGVVKQEYNPSQSWFQAGESLRVPINRGSARLGEAMVELLNLP
jgi:hypothetical protein